LYTKQVVSARAYAYQFLSYNSSRNCYPEMISRQINTRLDSVQNDTLFIYVGGQEGGFGGWVVILGQRPEINLDVPVYARLFLPPSCPWSLFM